MKYKRGKNFFYRYFELVASYSLGFSWTENFVDFIKAHYSEMFKHLLYVFQ